MLIKSLTVEPHPIVEPGNVTISAETQSSIPINAPLKVSPGWGALVRCQREGALGQLAGALRDVRSGSCEELASQSSKGHVGW